MRTFMGIDPGKSGAIAVVDRHGLIQAIYDRGKGTLHDEAAFFIRWKEAVACIEFVRSSPQQGVVSAFTFGQGYGQLLGMLAATQIPFVEVRPQKWQQAMRCLSKGDKNITKAAAQRLFPTQKVTHAIADALLLAEYCRTTWSR